MTIKQAQLNAVAASKNPCDPDSINGKIWNGGFHGQTTGVAGLAQDNPLYKDGQAARADWDAADKKARA